MVNPPKQGLFPPKQGSFGFQVSFREGIFLLSIRLTFKIGSIHAEGFAVTSQGIAAASSGYLGVQKKREIVSTGWFVGGVSFS